MYRTAMRARLGWAYRGSASRPTIVRSALEGRLLGHGKEQPYLPNTTTASFVSSTIIVFAAHQVKRTICRKARKRYT